MEEFREVLDECGFRDLGFVGGKFTWCNGHPNGFTICERLDRAVATMEWLEKFPTTKVIHLECGSSDHKPILICLNGIPRHRNKAWRFEHMWLEEEGCRDTVESSWLFDAPGQAMSRVEGKIPLPSKTQVVEPDGNWEYYPLIEGGKRIITGGGEGCNSG